MGIIETSSEFGVGSSELGKATLLKILLNKGIEDQFLFFEVSKIG
jgi:hypothetical protein